MSSREAISEKVTIVGGGLAGSEAAWQLAQRGISVNLMEMRPDVETGAHKTAYLAEIVCSNSLKSTLEDTASGLLKKEMEILGSRLLEAAYLSRVPAGHALAVDRDIFSKHVTESLANHPNINLRRECVKSMNFEEPAIVATGPLTESSFAQAISRHISKRSLYFYDAISPSVDASTVDKSICFPASRYGKGSPDYLNIPLDESDYDRILQIIRTAELVEKHPFEEERYFESCLPIEIMASRGRDTLRFGPLKPRGLIDPGTGKQPFAVLQLRQEKMDGSMLGLVGFQTRMKRSSQEKLIRSIPGLEKARILRYGSVHRNTYINTPQACKLLQRDKFRRATFYAGQICGVEGYVESIASGLIAALSVYACLMEKDFPELPAESMLGSLMRYIHTPCKNFQPMNANMGLLPAGGISARSRVARNRALTRRAVEAITRFKHEHSWLFR